MPSCWWRWTRSLPAALLLSGAAAGFPGEVLAQPIEVRLTLPSSPVSLIEGGRATFDVELMSEPGDGLLVFLRSRDSLAAWVTPNVMLFSPSNWNEPQTVTVLGIQDDDSIDESVTIDVFGPEVVNRTVTADVTDDDVPVALTLTPPAVTVHEGSTRTFTVELASQPLSRRTVRVESGDPGAATVDRARLDFTTSGWDDAQPVIVTGVQDNDTADERLAITLSGLGVTTRTVDVRVNDNDQPPPPPPPPLPQPPGRPQRPEVVQGDATLTVSWPSVSGADSYKVQWKSESQGYSPGVRQRIVDTPSVAITGLTNGTEYTVRVRASNAVGNSPWSEESSGTPQIAVPARPGPPNVEPGDGTLAVSWSAVPGADGYTVQWRSGSEAYAESRQQTESTLSVAIDGLTNGTAYDVRVRASNAGGDSPWSEKSSGTPQVAAPARPGRPGVEPGDGTLAVSWAAVPGADGYTVQWRSGSEAYAESRQQTESTLSVAIDGLTNGTAYDVRVRASNAGGDSPWSEESSGTPMTPVPALPPVGAGLLGLVLSLLGHGCWRWRPSVVAGPISSESPMREIRTSGCVSSQGWPVQRETAPPGQESGAP